MRENKHNRRIEHQIDLFDMHLITGLEKNISFKCIHFDWFETRTVVTVPLSIVSLLYRTDVRDSRDFVVVYIQEA